jgi:hypothetical protein
MSARNAESLKLWALDAESSKTSALTAELESPRIDHASRIE